MGLNNYKFGELIELTNKKNVDNIYGEADAIGVNMDKIIKPMRGDISEKNFDKFHLVPPRHFAYNPRGGSKLGLGFNDTNKTYIITFNDNVFRVKESAKEIILDSYLYMYLCRKEWDRFAEFISWGSSTVVFDWNDFCDIEITLPSLNIQQKYVDVYNAMLANQQNYERGLEDLKLVCDGYIEDLRRRMPCEKIGGYIEEKNNRNSLLQSTNVQGVNSSSTFGETRADTNGLDFHNYKIVSYNQFAYNPSRINLGSIALYKENKDCIISPMYCVFSVIDENKLFPEYLILWFGRKEFQRSTLYYAMGSVRDTFDFGLMKEFEIPIPDIEIQKSIVNIYNCYIERKRISEQLKAQIKDICPILIKGSIEEGRKEN